MIGIVHHDFIFFFFNDTATTEIYTLSLHDALPIYQHAGATLHAATEQRIELGQRRVQQDRKSTRLNSSHANISYAVFCLKKKKKKQSTHYYTTFIDSLIYIPSIF